MGIFDDIIICSDYDNTLTFEDKISDETLAAIADFRKNGGTFVIVTGRGYNGTEFFDPILKADRYLIVNNGTVLYEGDKVTQTVPLDVSPMEIAEQVLEKYKFITSFGVYWVEGTTRYYTDDASFELGKIAMNDATKLSFFCDTEQNADLLLKKISEKFGNSCEISKALPDNVEIFSKRGGKGKMALALKEKLRKKILVCMGDYDSDISMLEAADASFCPSNATQNVKSIADNIVENSKTGIMKSVIGFLTENTEEIGR